MNRQSSFENSEGAALYLVPTPIGNVQEMSPRAIETLQKADVIACEDTRNSGMLLKRLGIQKPLIAHHEFNQNQSVKGILELLENGKKVALISDAGYPLISDPGNLLVAAVSQSGYPVIPLSGPNAALNALVASGLNTSHYLFYGFLDSKSAKRKTQLESLKSFPFTMIFYEAPHRISAMLADLKEVLGNRQICLGRELTKLHEEFVRGSTEEVLTVTEGMKGEMVVVVEGAKPDERMSKEQVLEKMEQYCTQGNKPKQAAGLLSKESGWSKNEIYQLWIEQKEN
jgi:16S rRNA (cytidine1402-2'-O)-methyltransferase